jgi:hypothetical protein
VLAGDPRHAVVEEFVMNRAQPTWVFHLRPAGFAALRTWDACTPCSPNPASPASTGLDTGTFSCARPVQSPAVMDDELAHLRLTAAGADPGCPG